MHHYGIRGIANDWLKDYFKDRSQFVSVNDTVSSKRHISCGIPQGSILGPTLFLLYINDLCNISSKLHFILFADDTNLFISGPNVNETIDMLNRSVEYLV